MTKKTILLVGSGIWRNPTVRIYICPSLTKDVAPYAHAQRIVLIPQQKQKFPIKSGGKTKNIYEYLEIFFSVNLTLV